MSRGPNGPALRVIFHSRARAVTILLYLSCAPSPPSDRKLELDPEEDYHIYSQHSVTTLDPLPCSHRRNLYNVLFDSAPLEPPYHAYLIWEHLLRHLKTLSSDLSIISSFFLFSRISRRSGDQTTL